MLITIIAFIIIFSLLILVHEWGHFAAARRAGIHVEEFGIGLPPRAKKLYTDKKKTIFSLNWIPFGGYVRMFGEDATDPKILKDKKSFASKTIWQRTTVVVAGVFMNFLLAWILITIGFTFGMKPFLVTQSDLDQGIKNGIIESQKIYYIHDISNESPLIKVGLKKGDAITHVNKTPVSNKMVLKDIIKPNAGNSLTYMRDKKSATVNVLADKDGKFGMTISTQDLILNVKNVKYPFYLAPIKAFSEVKRLSVLTVKMLGTVLSSLIAKFTVPEGVAGPVGIARMTHYFAQQGFMALVQFTALLSISLGVINIMPFPALDGGRFLFIVYEFITRRRANAKWEAIIHTTGFALLMLFIVIITWNDIIQLIS